MCLPRTVVLHHRRTKLFLTQTSDCIDSIYHITNGTRISKSFSTHTQHASVVVNRRKYVLAGVERSCNCVDTFNDQDSRNIYSSEVR